VSKRSEHLILSASIASSGHHPGAAAWPPQTLDVAHFRRLVQTAERGLLDFVFLHDERALPGTAVIGRLDALSVLARLCRASDAGEDGQARTAHPPKRPADPR
jgi:hypothetical protein